MIGIYLITNTIDKKQYIGQSVDIQRRFMEHKAPGSKGNDRLHGDIQKYGADSFVFEVLEECKKTELNAKELFYIRKLNPYYNTIGKKRTDQERENISKGTKAWWDKLPDSKKQQIITNNLTGPAKGHKVSSETRMKISRKISENQKQKVMIVETGQIFESIRELERFLGACSGTVAAYRKGKIKTVKGYHVVECRD